MFDVNSVKNTISYFGAFAVGMLSITISNLFGGYYYAVAGAVVILSTIFVVGVFDQKRYDERKLEVKLLGLLCVVEVLFFVVNDLLSYDVYISNSEDFFSYLVLGSQFYCVAVMMLSALVGVSKYFRTSKVQVIERVEREAPKEKTFEEEFNKAEPVKDYEPTIDDEEIVEEIKSIPLIHEKKEVPFMEEEEE